MTSLFVYDHAASSYDFHIKDKWHSNYLQDVKMTQEIFIIVSLFHTHLTAEASATHPLWGGDFLKKTE